MGKTNRKSTLHGYDLLRDLGKGAFGEVFDAVPKVDEDTFDDADGIGGSTNRPFYLSPRLKDRKISLELAVKIIPKKTINTVQELVWLSQEVQMMYMLRNSLNIVQVRMSSAHNDPITPGSLGRALTTTTHRFT